MGFPQEGGFPAEAHRSTVGLRWGLLRRVRYGAVDAGRGVFRDVVGFPQEGGFTCGLVCTLFLDVCMDVCRSIFQ